MTFSFLFKKRPFIIYADDTTQCSFAKTLSELVTILQLECETAINWLSANKMTVNPD